MRLKLEGHCYRKLCEDGRARDPVEDLCHGIWVSRAPAAVYSNRRARQPDPLGHIFCSRPGGAPIFLTPYIVNASRSGLPEAVTGSISSLVGSADTTASLAAAELHNPSPVNVAQISQSHPRLTCCWHTAGMNSMELVMPLHLIVLVNSHQR